MANENLPEDLKEYIDVEAGLARIMGNKKVYVRMLGIFKKTKEFDSFDESLQSQDFEKASEVAHTIKGMTGNLAFTKLYDISSILNVELKDGIKNDELITELFAAKEKTMKYIELLEKEFV